MKGKKNFSCEVKDDFRRNQTYRCKSCGPYISRKGGECQHTTVEYGPCMDDKNFNCQYKTKFKDYVAINKGTIEEVVFINRYNKVHYQDDYSEWSHLDNLKESAIRDWRPCEYFHQTKHRIKSKSFCSELFYLLSVFKQKPSFKRLTSIRRSTFVGDRGCEV